MPRFQIRTGDIGVALYDTDSPREALLQFFADRARGEFRSLVEVSDDGQTAKVTHDGVVYEAV